MSNSDYNDLIQINDTLQAMLTSEEVRQEAANSDSALLKSAAAVMALPIPTMPDDASDRVWRTIQQTLIAIPKSQRNTSAKDAKPNRQSNWIRRLMILGALLIAIGYSVKLFSANSLPDDWLYAAKLGFERLDMMLANDGTSQYEQYLSQAQARLQEIDALAPSDAGVDDLLGAAFDNMESALSLARDGDLYRQNPVLREVFSLTLSEADQQLEALTLTSDVQAAFETRLSDLRETFNTPLPDPPPSAADATATLAVTPTPTRTRNTGSATQATADDVQVIAPLGSATRRPSDAEATSESTAESTAEATSEATAEVTGTVAAEGELIGSVLYVIDGRVNVRAGASTEYDVIGIAVEDNPVTILDTNLDESWYKVRLPNGGVGWMAAFLLTETVPDAVNDVDDTEDDE